MNEETAKNRIAVTPTTHDRLREFRNGLNASYDDAINLLLDLAVKSDDEYMAGKRLRELEKTPQHP